MKSLRVNFLFISLLAATILSMVIISCEKEIPPTPKTVKDHQSFNVETRQYLMPKGFGEKTETEQAAIVENLSIDDEVRFEENLKIALYLMEIGKYETINQTLKQGQIFTEISLERHLSTTEMNGVKTFNPSTLNIEEAVNSRGVCTPWWHNYYWTSNGPDCLDEATNWCCEWKGRWRNCLNLDGSYVEREHKLFNMCW